jgi:hypothetical protein
VDDGSTLMYDNFTVEYVHFNGTGGVGSSLPPSMSTPVPEPLPTSAPRSPATTSVATRSSPPPPQPVPPCPPAATTTPPGTSTPTPARVENLVEFGTLLSHDEERIDAYHDGEPLRYRTMENLLGDQPVPGLAPHDLEAQLHLVCNDSEPQSFAEAERHAAWHVAMQSEMDAVEKNCTWELADLPCGQSAITLKWVFMQREGIDFDDTFAPVARMESVRLLSALAAQEGWRVHHMDVKSALLNGDLKEEVYMHQPPGFAIPGKEGKVLRLRKTLYGLRHAPRA